MIDADDLSNDKNLYTASYMRVVRRLALEEAASCSLFPVINTYEQGNPAAEHYQAGVAHLRRAIRALIEPASPPER